MSKRPLPPIGFWSYARPDDELSGGQLSRLRALIRAELQQQYGREPIQLFQDISAISHGSRWENEIRRALENSTFFIPILSPNFLQSEWCVQEVLIFQERQERLFAQHPDMPRTSRIFPIHYIDVMGIQGLDPQLDQSLRELQWFDFRDFRHHDFNSAEVRRTVSGFVTSVRDLLRVQVEQEETPRPAPAPPLPTAPGVVTAPPASPATSSPAPVTPDPRPPEQSAPSPAYDAASSSGAGGGGSKLPLVIGGVVALLAVVALAAFFLLRGSGGRDDTAASNNSAVAVNSAAATAEPEEADAELAAPSGELAEALIGGWGDDEACESSRTDLRADGSVLPAEDGRWTVEGEQLVIVAPDGTAWRAAVEFLDDDGTRIRLTEEGEEPVTWVKCAA